MRALPALVLCAAAAACASSSAQSGPSTGRGTLPTAAVEVTPGEAALDPVATGPAPFVDVPLRRRLSGPLSTAVLYCVDDTGQVVYSEIQTSSKEREFDEQVRTYFAQSTFRPYADDTGTARPACTTSTLTYEEPRSLATGRSAGGLTTTRANSYIPDCTQFAVQDSAVVCANETTRAQERIIQN